MLLTTQTGVSASGNTRSKPVRVQEGAQWAEFLLNVTSAATAAGDTLDVYIQASVDGTIWDDVLHFTQVLGNGGAKQYLARWQGMIAPTTALAAPQDAAVTGVAQGPHGLLWSVKWVIASASAPLFTFTVEASGDVKQNN